MARLRTTGIVFAILSIFFIAFPPWYPARDGGYAPIWDPPHWSTRLDGQRLLAQLAGGLSLSFLIAFVIAPWLKGSARRYFAVAMIAAAVVLHFTVLHFTQCWWDFHYFFAPSLRVWEIRDSERLIAWFPWLGTKNLVAQTSANAATWTALIGILAPILMVGGALWMLTGRRITRIWLGSAAFAVFLSFILIGFLAWFWTLHRTDHSMPAGGDSAVKRDQSSSGGKTTSATVDWEKELADVPVVQRDTARFLRATAYAKERDFDKAIADYTDAIRLDPGYSEAYYYRGVAYQEKGDRAKAELDFDQAKRLGFKPP